MDKTEPEEKGIFQLGRRGGIYLDNDTKIEIKLVLGSGNNSG